MRLHRISQAQIKFFATDEKRILDVAADDVPAQ
jgi:hypothetical protein